MYAQTRPRFILSSEGVLGGMEFESMLTPREKSPLQKMSPEEDRTRDAVDSEPKYYQLSYSGPRSVVEIPSCAARIERPPPPPPTPPPPKPPPPKNTKNKKTKTKPKPKQTNKKTPRTMSRSLSAVPLQYWQSDNGTPTAVLPHLRATQKGNLARPHSVARKLHGSLGVYCHLHRGDWSFHLLLLRRRRTRGGDACCLYEGGCLTNQKKKKITQPFPYSHRLLGQRQGSVSAAAGVGFNPHFPRGVVLLSGSSHIEVGWFVGCLTS